MTDTPLAGSNAELADILDFSEHGELRQKLIAWRDAAVAAERERCAASLDRLAAGWLNRVGAPPGSLAETAAMATRDAYRVAAREVREG